MRRSRLRALRDVRAWRLLLLAGLVAACASPGPDAAATPAAALATASATTGRSSAPPSPASDSSLAPTPSPVGIPPVEPIEPSAVIDVSDATGAIAVTTDGKTVWAATNGAILRIDIATKAVKRLAAPVQSDDTTLAIAADGLWATRWAGGRLYRFNPRTGRELLTTEMPKAVRIAFVGDDLWVGREDAGQMFEVDRKTGAVGASVSGGGAYGTAGLGDLWFARGGSPTIVRIDPSTGDVRATIDAPGESNCAVGGAFPDSIWTGCFGREVQPRTAARIDPDTNTVATVVTVPPSHGVSGVLALDGKTWVVAAFEHEGDGTLYAGLLRVDPDTGTIERFLSLEGVDPNTPVVGGGALWIPDETGARIVRVDAAVLAD